MEVLLNTSLTKRGEIVEIVEVAGVARATSDSNRSTSSNGERKKKDRFSSKIHIPEFGGKKGHSTDVTEVFRRHRP